jgi:hypothetical protein
MSIYYVHRHIVPIIDYRIDNSIINDNMHWRLELFIIS